MSQAADAMAEPAQSRATLLYEQPLNERMRTFLRLEFLYQQLSYHADDASLWSSRGAVHSLLDVAAILSRGDVRGDVLKELERQLFTLERLKSTQHIDTSRLDNVMTDLRARRERLNAVGPKYLQELRDNEFLNAIRHRSSIPGGTCAFDIPEYTHWLRQSYQHRTTDINRWINVVHPLCESVLALLWLMRNSKKPVTQVATGGVFQYSMDRNNSSALIRIILPNKSELYPEISGGQHRFTVRLMRLSDTDNRPEQIREDVEFQLAVC